MTDFDQLVALRREWIDRTLIPWCRAASRKELIRAEREWGDIAGRVDSQRTLWMWAWSRFPGLVVDDLQQIDETYAVTVTLKSGERATGYPDARKSERASLVLVGDEGELGPFLIDDVASVERC